MGVWSVQDSKNLVPGDVAQFIIGDIVPADLSIAELKSVWLQVEEAPLTGESMSSRKPSNPWMKTLISCLAEEHDVLFNSNQLWRRPWNSCIDIHENCYWKSAGRG